MIFGFGKRRPADDTDDDDDEEIENILFKGALNENNPNLNDFGKLVQAGLVPAKELVSDALSRRAEIIRVEPKGKVAAVTLFVDGIPSPPTRMAPQTANAITQMLKLLAGLDIQIRDAKQSGGINAEYEEIPYVVRVDVSPVEGGGERLLVRCQNAKIQLETPKDLGFSEELQSKIREIGSSKQGVMLAVGPPMSGVTTLSIAIVRGIDAYLYSIGSIADLQGRDLPHIQEFKWIDGDNLEATLKRSKRADIEVIFMDPLIKADDARVALKSSHEQCIIAEMAAKDAADGIARLVALAGDAKLVAENLKLIVSQRLVRLLCRKCRLAYRPNPKLLAKLGLPTDTKKLYRAPKPDEDEDEEDREVCPACGGTGYMGRTGLIEMVLIDDDIKKLILEGADPAKIRAKAKESGMQSFQSDGLRIVAEGKTAIEELQRAFRE